MQYTLTSAHVQHLTASLLRSYLKLKDFGRSCPAATLLAVLFSAAARLCSLFAAARRLLRAPSHETVRNAVAAQLSGIRHLQRRLNKALTALLPAGLRRRRHRLAIDLTLIPYHGRPDDNDNELLRGQAKSGTTHFHGYATAYLIRHGCRFTLALRYVERGEKMEAIVKDLLRRCAQVGVRPELLLLDRGFWGVGVIRYLQAARCPFLMPVIARGKKARTPGGPSGTRVFWGWRRGGFGTYTLQETGKGRKAKVSICVHRRPRRGRRGKRGMEHLVYAWWGFEPSSPYAVSQLYRQRFGIETSYRQMNQGRIPTCSRNPAVRLLLVGVALLLRNVWVYLHEEVLSEPRRGRRRYHLERLPLLDLLLWLLHEAERLLGVVDETSTQRPIPEEFMTADRQHLFCNY